MLRRSCWYQPYSVPRARLLYVLPSLLRSFLTTLSTASFYPPTSFTFQPLSSSTPAQLQPPLLASQTTPPPHARFVSPAPLTVGYRVLDSSASRSPNLLLSSSSSADHNSPSPLCCRNPPLLSPRALLLPLPFSHASLSSLPPLSVRAPPP